jgi:hypothetical protein
MGSEFSRQEQIEYGQYRNKIDEALRDSPPYQRFMEVRDRLAGEIKANKPNVHRYAVAYVKKVIKTKNLPNSIKFNALLLLKELMKTRAPQLVNYNNTKIMQRLEKLASSPSRQKVLLEYNSRSNAEDSGKFYHLLLECLARWGDNYGPMNAAYADTRNRLVKAGRLPVQPLYYDIPQDIQPQAVVNSAAPQELNNHNNIRSILDGFKFERVKVLDSMRRAGNQLFTDQDVLNNFKRYDEDKDSIDRNPFVQNLMNNPSTPENAELVNEFQNEIMMYDFIKEQFKKLDPSQPATIQKYMDDIQETHRNLFGSNINFTQKSGRDIQNEPMHQEVLNNREYNVPVMQSDRGIGMGMGSQAMPPLQPIPYPTDAYAHANDHGSNVNINYQSQRGVNVQGAGGVGSGAGLYNAGANYGGYQPENRVLADGGQQSNVDAARRSDIPLPVQVPVPVSSSFGNQDKVSNNYNNNFKYADDVISPLAYGREDDEYNFGGRKADKKEVSQPNQPVSSSQAGEKPQYVINYNTSNYYTSNDNRKDIKLGAERPAGEGLYSNVDRYGNDRPYDKAADKKPDSNLAKPAYDYNNKNDTYGKSNYDSNYGKPATDTYGKSNYDSNYGRPAYDSNYGKKNDANAKSNYDNDYGKRPETYGRADQDFEYGRGYDQKDNRKTNLGSARAGERDGATAGRAQSQGIRILEARSFEEEGFNSPQRTQRERNAMNSEGGNNIDRKASMVRLQNIKTEASQRVSRLVEEDGTPRNPFKNANMSNSKEFYKAYFSGGNNYSARGPKDYQFQTEGIKFVNGVYHDINNTVARNVY